MASNVYGRPIHQWKEAMLKYCNFHHLPVHTGFDVSAERIGIAASATLKTIQHHAHILETGTLDVSTCRVLTPMFSPAPPPINKKMRAVGEWWWCHGVADTETAFPYAEIRPMPLLQYSIHEIPLPPTDCSGLVTCIAKRVGLPDPNGLEYSGQGFTGTMLNHLQHIERSQATAGDLVVFGGGEGVHVVQLLSASPTGLTDPLVGSHGLPGIQIMPLSHYTGYFHGMPVTFLKVVPS